MRPRWYGILLAGGLAGWMAGCTSAASPDESKPVPDAFNENLDLITRAAAHACGADLDEFDGQVVEHFSYVHDALGRLQRTIAVDATGAPLEQIDYTWDNAGHQTNRRDAKPGSLEIDSWLYDTLGRLMEARGTTSDTDPANAHQTARFTIDYADLDALGHAAHSSELREDLDAHTASTTTTSYDYDDLGRLTSLQVRSASGDPLQSEQLEYDDAAHTRTWQVQSPQAPPDLIGGNFGAVEQYDGDGHWLSTHLEYVGLDGAVISTNDAVVTWDGDRELAELTTLTPAGSPQVKLHISKTFKYECDSAR